MPLSEHEQRILAELEESLSKQDPRFAKNVRETNVCAIKAIADERTGKVFVFAAIDNLWKGTSSQALANLNLMFGFDEGLGLR